MDETELTFLDDDDARPSSLARPGPEAHADIEAGDEPFLIIDESDRYSVGSDSSPGGGKNG